MTDNISEMCHVVLFKMPLIVYYCIAQPQWVKGYFVMVCLSGHCEETKHFGAQEIF